MTYLPSTYKIQPFAMIIDNIEEDNTFYKKMLSFWHEFILLIPELDLVIDKPDSWHHQ
jgi:hypothetical protein